MESPEAHWALFFRNLFQSLDRRGYINRDSPSSDLFSLAEVFLPTLQECLTEWCAVWNYHTIRPQANRGISSYRPVDRFVRGQLHLEGMSSHECQHALGELAAHPDLLDAGHNEEPAAISVAHRGAGARSSYPFIVDPQSTPEWRTLRNRLVRQLSDPAYEPELQYLFHRMVCQQLVRLKT